MKEDINPDRLYKISEMVEKEFILNTMNKPDRLFIRKLIVTGKLKASNRGFGKKLPFWMAYGRDIIEYRQSI